VPRIASYIQATEGPSPRPQSLLAALDTLVTRDHPAVPRPPLPPEWPGMPVGGGGEGEDCECGESRASWDPAGEFGRGKVSTVPIRRVCEGLPE